MGVAIEQLKKEHAAIERMIVILETVCRRLEAGEPVDAAHISQIVEFFHGFADECHHGKEEAVLFPALEKVGIPGVTLGSVPRNGHHALPRSI